MTVEDRGRDIGYGNLIVLTVVVWCACMQLVLTNQQTIILLCHLIQPPYHKYRGTFALLTLLKVVARVLHTVVVGPIAVLSNPRPARGFHVARHRPT